MDYQLYEYLGALCKGEEYHPEDSNYLLNILGRQYINDGSSFIVHEKVTVETAGYTHSDAKNGYDGFFVDENGEYIMVEAKTSNIKFDPEDCEVYVRGDRKGQPKPTRKFDGAGVFSSYSHALFKKHFENTVLMLVSGFLNGRLLYIIEFPFDHPTFVDHLQKRLDKQLPNGDAKGLAVNLGFRFNHYDDCQNAKLKYLADESVIENNKHFFNKNLYDFIMRLKKC